MCIELNLSIEEAIQLINDFTADHARNVVEIYFDMMPISQQHCCDLINLEVAFQTGETFYSVVSAYYSCDQNGKEMEDTFQDEVKVVACKVVSTNPSWRTKAKVSIQNYLKNLYYLLWHETFCAPAQKNYHMYSSELTSCMCLACTIKRRQGHKVL